MMLHMPLPDDVLRFAEAMTGAGHDFVVVGGAVRNALLGRAPGDLDVVTSAKPEEVREIAEDAAWCSRAYDLGERFGTVGVVLTDGSVVELTRYRDEALGESNPPARFAIDAKTRDLTINAMALSLPCGLFLDPLGAAEDLGTRTLRAPGDATERFAEDPLRVLRVARLVGELGFAVEPRTRRALDDTAARLDGIAPERIRVELTKLLVSEHVQAGLALAHACGALAVVLPEVAALDGIEQPSFHDLDVLGHTLQVTSGTSRDARLRWASLLHDTGKASTANLDATGRIRFHGQAAEGAVIAGEICSRLKFSNDDTAAIVHLVREHMRLGDLDLANERAVDRAVRRLDLWSGEGDTARLLASAEEAADLAAADLGATAHRDDAPAFRETLDAAIAGSRERGTSARLKLPVTGRAVMSELGIGQGPAVGEALAAVADAVAEGSLGPTDRVAALEIARNALAKG